MNHPTVSVVDSVSVTALVFVGPPASGKSTVCAIMEGYSVPVCDVAVSHDNGSIVNDEWKQLVVDTIEDAARTQPHVCCIEGPLSDEQVEFVREHVDGALVIRVRVQDRADRIERYIARELDTDVSVVDEREIADLRADIERREALEAPYPRHDIVLSNDGPNTSGCIETCGNILCAVSDYTSADIKIPSSVEGSS